MPQECGDLPEGKLPQQACRASSGGILFFPMYYQFIMSLFLLGVETMDEARKMWEN